MCLQSSQSYMAFIGPNSAVQDGWADRLEQKLSESIDSCCHGSLIGESRMPVLIFLFLFVFIEREAGSLSMESQACHPSIWD